MPLLPHSGHFFWYICFSYLRYAWYVYGDSFQLNFAVLYQDYEAMVAQLEHQFRLGRLSIQGLWFYCQVSLLSLNFFIIDTGIPCSRILIRQENVFQPMMASMQALATVIRKASANNFTGSAVLNLLQSQVESYN